MFRCSTRGLILVNLCQRTKFLSCTIGGVESKGILTISSAVTERPLDASCLSVVSFNIPTALFLVLVTAASDLLVHEIRLGSGRRLAGQIGSGERVSVSFQQNTRRVLSYHVL